MGQHMGQKSEIELFTMYLALFLRLLLKRPCTSQFRPSFSLLFSVINVKNNNNAQFKKV